MTYEHYCKVRTFYKLKDAQVARESGVNKSTFSDWKAGKSKPKEDKLRKIADCFGISMELFQQPISENKPFVPILKDSCSFISSEEYEFLVLFRNATESAKESVMVLLKNSQKESLELSKEA